MSWKTRLATFLISPLMVVLLLAQVVFAATSPWSQSDWSGGSGQTAWSDATKFSSSSSVTTSTANQITLPNTEEFSNTGFETDLTGWNTGAQPDSISGLKLWLKADAGITRAAGMAAQFTAANSETLSIAGNTSLQMGVTEFTMCFWVYLDSVATTDKQIIDKYSSPLVTSTSSVASRHVLGTGFRFSWIDGAGVAQSVTDTAIGVASINTWYFVVMGFKDGVAWIEVNNQRTTQVPVANTTINAGSTATPFRIGGTNGIASLTDGRIQGVGIWKRQLTTAETAEMYNSGVGLAYDQLSPSMKTSMVSYWELNEPSGTRSDLHGTNHLTDNNTVTTNPGIIQNAVSAWADQSGNGNNATQATQANQPVYRASVQNSLPGLWFDDTDDFLAANGVASSFTGEDKPFTVFTVIKLGSVATSNSIWSAGSSSTATPYIWGVASTTYATQIRDDTVTTKNWNAAGTPNTSPHIFVTTTTGTLGNLFVDGARVGVADADVNVGTLTLNQFGIGALYRNVGTNFLAGYVSELFVVNSALSSADRSRIENYLRDRYSITV